MLLFTWNVSFLLHDVVRERVWCDASGACESRVTVERAAPDATIRSRRSAAPGSSRLGPGSLHLYTMQRRYVIFVEIQCSVAKR